MLACGVVSFNPTINCSSLSTGVYLLEVQNSELDYPTIRVKISPKDDSVNSLPIITAATADVHRKRQRVAHPLNLRPLGKKNYFTERKPFNPMDMLKNPMIIMMGVMMLAVMLLKSVDPEELKAAQVTPPLYSSLLLFTPLYSYFLCFALFRYSRICRYLTSNTVAGHSFGWLCLQRMGLAQIRRLHRQWLEYNN